MQPEVIQRLLEVNQVFYQTFGGQFSVTRRRLQPGVQKLLAGIPLQAHLLDLGCGNGELIRILVKKGFEGTYLGLDFSQPLLQDASCFSTDRIQFLNVDLGKPGWDGQVNIPGSCTHVLAFAVLHHLPSDYLRTRIVRAVRSLLPTDGLFMHSHWQFLNSPRLAARRQPWERIGLTADQVDPGDWLMDWRRGGSGLRYVHHFTQEELQALAKGAGFSIEQTFLSDGEAGRLGLYQVWRAA